ncbi:MAG TPA: iron-containing alcohol dehydrogenase [Solirubrobacteraceae bacterium]|jgi:alcohol dehydrogenase class IV|nr:iron-containing alcohol dehydrogenase [Solirubrobacteraceae bacterium]
MAESFRQVEHQRTIVFGRGTIDTVGELVGEGFVLLSTPRARAAAGGVLDRAGVVIDVPRGRVDEIAADLRHRVSGGPLVALGGGRVIDVAKALAAADPPRGVVGIPTTLSAAEMTAFHRQAAGVGPQAPHVRPALVINDPDLSGSQPAGQLAASTGNAFGHAIVAIFSVGSNPVARAVGRAAAARLVGGWAASEPDRDELALGALLAGWAVDCSGLGPHHAIAQTLVRLTGVGHGEANVALLESSIAGIRRRLPGGVEELESDVGVDLEAFARRLRVRAGALGIDRLRDDPQLLDRVVTGAASRPELERVAPAPDPDELRAIYRAAASMPVATDRGG